MKFREGFVTNSSPSSFIIVTLGDKEILINGDTGMESCGWTSMDIDNLMDLLQQAKSGGITKIGFEHGGGYEG